MTYIRPFYTDDLDLMSIPYSSTDYVFDVHGSFYLLDWNDPESGSSFIEPKIHKSHRAYWVHYGIGHLLQRPFGRFDHFTQVRIANRLFYDSE